MSDERAPLRRRASALAACAAFALGTAALAVACAPIIGLDEDEAKTIDLICSCAEFNFAGALADECKAAAARPEHQTPEFLESYLAADAAGISCPDCSHLQTCLFRLELDERYIPCQSNDQCPAHQCCVPPQQMQATCCTNCAGCM